MRNYRKISGSFTFRKLVRGLSIIELLVVLAVIALLVTLAIPAMNAMQKSLGSGGAESMISTALATARTLAIKNGHYAGVRFQKAWEPNEDPLKAQQYMIFITYNSDKSGLICGFIAVDGYKPIKLPENINVADKMRRTTYSTTPADCASISEISLAVTDNLGSNVNLADITTFSIVFSPSGKLVTQEVRCRNNDGEPRNSVVSNDDIFNTINKMQSVTPRGMFIQDDFDDIGIGVENSRTSFVIYEREKFGKLPATGTQRYNYINGLKVMNINPYTGEIIK